MALHPRHQYALFVEIPLTEVETGTRSRSAARAGAQREENRHAERGDRFPERSMERSREG